MATIRLYRTEAASRGLDTSSSPVQPTRPERSLALTSDDHLVAILDAPHAPGETMMAGFARKEHELGAAFAQLSVFESRALHARLSNPKTGDVLANKFARLTLERRTRLLAFLGDVRRRLAMAGRRSS